MDKQSSIKLFEEKKVRTAWNEDEEEWYFSVQDVVEILTDSADVKQYIKKMLSRDEQLKNNWGTICTPVEMKAADGKMRKADVEAEPFQIYPNMLRMDEASHRFYEIQSSNPQNAKNVLGVENV